MNKQILLGLALSFSLTGCMEAPLFPTPYPLNSPHSNLSQAQLRRVDAQQLNTMPPNQQQSVPDVGGAPAPSPDELYPMPPAQSGTPQLNQAPAAAPTYAPPAPRQHVTLSVPPPTTHGAFQADDTSGTGATTATSQ